MNMIALVRFQSFILLIILKDRFYVHLLNVGIIKIIIHFMIIVINLNNFINRFKFFY